MANGGVANESPYSGVANESPYSGVANESPYSGVITIFVTGLILILQASFRSDFCPS